MLPARPEVAVEGHALANLHRINLPPEIGRRVQVGTGAASHAGEKLAAVDSQARDPRPFPGVLEHIAGWVKKAADRSPRGAFVVAEYLCPRDGAAIELP